MDQLSGTLFNWKSAVEAYESLATDRRPMVVISAFSQGWPWPMVVLHPRRIQPIGRMYNYITVNKGDGFLGLRLLNLPFFARCQTRVAHPHIPAPILSFPLGTSKHSRHLAPTARGIFWMEVLAVMPVRDCQSVSGGSCADTSSCWTIDQQPALAKLSNKTTEMGQKLGHTIDTFAPSYGMRVNHRRWMNAVLPLLLHLTNEKADVSTMDARPLSRRDRLMRSDEVEVVKVESILLLTSACITSKEL